MPTEANNTTWAVGITLAIGANFVSNLGLNFQKLAHSRREKNAISEDTSYVCDPIWISGMAMVVVGAISDFAALGFAPQSVVAPLGSLTLVVNVFLAPIMQNEKVTKKTTMATGGIILGSVLTVLASTRADSLDNVGDVFEIYTRSAFWIYAVFAFGLCGVMWGTVKYLKKLSESENEQDRIYYDTKGFKIHRFAIACLSGTMGAQNLLFAKSASTLVVLTLDTNARGVMFIKWETYLILAALTTTIVLQLRWLNSGLKRFSALHIVPYFQAFWIFVSVLGGLIVYREWVSMTSFDRVLFPFGVLITMSSVLYLTSQAPPGQIGGSSVGTQSQVGEQATLDEALLQEEVASKVSTVSRSSVRSSESIKSRDTQIERYLTYFGDLAEGSVITPSGMGRLFVTPDLLERVDEQLQWRTENMFRDDSLMNLSSPDVRNQETPNVVQSNPPRQNRSKSVGITRTPKIDFSSEQQRERHRQNTTNLLARMKDQFFSREPKPADGETDPLVDGNRGQSQSVTTVNSAEWHLSLHTLEDEVEPDITDAESATSTESLHVTPEQVINSRPRTNSGSSLLKDAKSSYNATS